MGAADPDDDRAMSAERLRPARGAGQHLPVRPAAPRADGSEGAEGAEGFEGSGPGPDGGGAAQTVYEAAGGMPFFVALVDRFYENVAADRVLRALYPAADLRPAARRLTLFLAQYWGGPRTYEAERGQPRLRARHFPFAIGPAGRDRWLRAMRDAVAFTDPPPAIAAQLLAYFDLTAEAMRNQD
jgi:hemoglobin